jgi:hypothetical protein
LNAALVWLIVVITVNIECPAVLKVILARTNHIGELCLGTKSDIRRHYRADQQHQRKKPTGLSVHVHCYLLKPYGHYGTPD